MTLNRLAFWLRECIAILFWSLLLLKLFIFDFDAYLIQQIAPAYLWLLNLKGLIFLVFILCIWLILGHRSFLKLFAYIVGYPFVVLLWSFPKACLTNWPIAITFAPVLYIAIKRFRSTLILYTIAMMSVATIFLSASRWQLIAAIIGLSVFQANYIFRIFQDAFSESLFAKLAKFTRNINSKAKILEGLFQNQSNTLSSTIEEKSRSSESLLHVYIIHAGIDIIAQRVTHVINTRKYDMYLAGSWLYTVVITIIIYTFLYYGISRLDPEAFSPPQLLNLPRFLHFSIGTITATGNSGIQAVSPLAITVYISECLHIPLLIITLVFIVLTTQREQYRHDADDFRLALREFSDAIEGQISEVYKITALALEVSIHKHNLWLVTQMRRARGLPELINDDPQKPEQATASAPSPSINTPPKNV